MNHSKKPGIREDPGFASLLSWVPKEGVSESDSPVNSEVSEGADDWNRTTDLARMKRPL